MEIHSFFKAMEYRLQRTLPGETAQLRMAPVSRLSNAEYYRLGNRNPSPGAVLVMLYERNDRVFTVLMQRPPGNGVHSNQVSFPGGKIEASDASPEAAALREAEEEIGVSRTCIRPIGRLTPVYIPVSNYKVEPVVGYLEMLPAFVLNPAEALKAIELPMDLLDKRDRVHTGRFDSGKGQSIEAPYYESGGVRIWGATAMILSELSSIYQEIVTQH